jgi:glutamate carboxypeptidase
MVAWAAPTALKAPERKLAAFIEAHQPETLALLERSVNINSGTHNPKGVREVGALFREALDSLKFQTKWIEGEGFGRAGHLVADHPGPGPRIVLIGHLDTVFETDSPFQRFERLDDARARGPGIIDMKGGDVILISALRALEAAGLLKSLNVAVVMTGDEEDPGHPLGQSREALRAAARGARMGIGFEDGDGDPKHAVTARRGSTSWRMSVQGTPAHSSQIFREDIGAGAIFEAARILETFRARLSGESHLTFNPGVILGGTSVELDEAGSRGSAFGKSNVVAEHLEAAGDLRALTREQFENAEVRMREIVGQATPHTQARIVFEEGYPPLPPGEGNDRLLALYDEVSKDLGLGPVTATDPDKAGAADVAYLSGQVAMILDGVGLKGKGGHTPEETADLNTLTTQTKRAAVLLYRLSKSKP